MTRVRAIQGCVVATVLMAIPLAAEAQPNGTYECWFFGSPRGGMNFTLDGRNYTGSDGGTGTLTGSAFRGGTNDGIRYQYKGGNPPTFSILGPRGDEVSTCQLAR